MNDKLSLRTVEDMAGTVRSARAAQKLTQAQLAEKAGVGRLFVIELEAGHPRAELAKVLSVLDALGLDMIASPVADQHPAHHQ